MLVYFHHLYLLNIMLCVSVVMFLDSLSPAQKFLEIYSGEAIRVRYTCSTVNLSPRRIAASCYGSINLTSLVVSEKTQPLRTRRECALMK